MKNSLKYVLLIIFFIALVISVTVSTLYIKYEIKGEFKYNRRYYDIKYSNVFMDNDDIIVKVDENNNSIHIDIPELEKENTISVDVSNIGNSDIVVDSYSITNVDTSLNKDNISVVTSLEKDDVLKGGNSEKIIINIKNNNKEKGHFNFNINYIFKES